MQEDNAAEVLETRDQTEREMKQRHRHDREAREREIRAKAVAKRRVRLNISKSHNKVYEWILLEYDAEFYVCRPFEIEFQWKSVSGYAALTHSACDVG